MNIQKSSSIDRRKFLSRAASTAAATITQEPLEQLHFLPLQNQGILKKNIQISPRTVELSFIPKQSGEHFPKGGLEKDKLAV